MENEPINIPDDPPSTQASSDANEHNSKQPLTSPSSILPKDAQRVKFETPQSPDKHRSRSPSHKSLSLKSKSVAELSPTTAYSKSLPTRKESPGHFPSGLSNLFQGFSLSPPKTKVERESDSGTQHIGVTIPRPLEYPLPRHVLDKLEDVQFKVDEILERNIDAICQAEQEKGQEDKKSAESDNYAANPAKQSSDSSSNFSRSLAPPVDQSYALLGKDCKQLPVLEEVDPLEGAEASEDQATDYTSDSESGNEDSPISGSSCPPRTRSSSRAQSCPRIRRGEDLRDYSLRLSSQPVSIPGTDGAYDLTPRASYSDMNNFSNFDAGNMNPNLARQAPAQPGQQQTNGGFNGVQQWPNVGAQSDMNVLWEYIIKLSDMHEQIRAQTQSVASGMQQIEGMRNGTSSSSGGPVVNGAVNGIPPSTSESSQVASLQTDLLAAQSRNEDLQSYLTTLQNLNTDYENAISHTLDKLRPFAQSHAQALLAQKAHYLNLLEQERSANLELRLEQSRWQEKAKECKDMMVEALKAQSEMELGYVRKIAALKADNRSLRRICNVPLMEESEDEDQNGDGSGIAGHGSARMSPELVRAPEGDISGQGQESEGRRVLIS